MRWSQAFIPTLRDDPADAEAASHRLLVRGGFIRQLMSGVYSLLPLGHRVRAKIMAIIREEIDAIESGVEGVVILNGKTAHAVLLEIFTTSGVGTSA